MRLGAIGIDSSHLPEFTKRIKALHDAGQTPCRVTSFWSDGRHDLPQKDVERCGAAAIDLGAKQADTLENLLENVDGVLVLAVNGNRHLELAMPSLERGLPTYIDKPLTCDLKQAKQILKIAREKKARGYSASSLRFAAEVTEMNKAPLGRLVTIDAFGPGERNPSMAGLFFYGVHTIEMVDAIWGPGVRRVSAITMKDRDLLDLEYHDGRYARLRMERAAAYVFSATVHGDKAVHSFKVDFADVYNRLVKGMVRFFEGGDPPANLRDIVENIAVMEAGNASMEQDGAWIDVEPVE